MIQEIIAAFFMALGIFFCVASLIGYYRLPDFYARMHASGNSETIALLLIAIGFIVYNGWNLLSIKVVILFCIVCACNPIGSHVLARAAYKNDFPMERVDRADEGEE
ncbi:monovalent cation/H(+) antiporter subunit G [Eubacterium oxidoreducens]|uniref:Multisubunit sodium/proton antiporter, MrpG subunit n=1 Tax=Eubacterium oxidoreducens TaxID=1732 RepID=A0A1G6BSJ7_EUBOX|nr:monovalent cation/H(+) antiporter subunit G [Eubacterium oxidoreducens]SDB23507.1 multisubunit sodium/proton antiporter, MrpG subunit [Eubacterium oxidoreducens]